MLSENFIKLNIKLKTYHYSDFLIHRNLVLATFSTVLLLLLFGFDILHYNWIFYINHWIILINYWIFNMTIGFSMLIIGFFMLTILFSMLRTWLDYYWKKSFLKNNYLIISNEQSVHNLLSFTLFSLIFLRCKHQNHVWRFLVIFC